MNRCMNKLAWNQLKWSYFKMLTFCDACPCCDASSYVSSHLCSDSCSSSVCSSLLCSPVCSRLGSARVTGFEPSWGRKSEPYTNIVLDICNGWRVLAAGQPPQRGPAASPNYLPPSLSLSKTTFSTHMTWLLNQKKWQEKDENNSQLPVTCYTFSFINNLFEQQKRYTSVSLWEKIKEQIRRQQNNSTLSFSIDLK